MLTIVNRANTKEHYSRKHNTLINVWVDIFKQAYKTMDSSITEDPPSTVIDVDITNNPASPQIIFTIGYPTTILIDCAWRSKRTCVMSDPNCHNIVGEFFKAAILDI